MNNYIDELQIKEKLGIENWRQLSKEKVVELIQMSPNIDKEIYLGILENIPNIVENNKVIVESISDIISSNKEISNNSNNLYMHMLDTLKEISKDADETEIKKEIINLMNDIRQDIKEINDKSIQDAIELQKDAMNKLGLALVGMFAVCGVGFVIKKGLRL
ncbi:hypothetical protein [Romboutsia lituseburensis]|uniref:hypothetical protein n=1 Tax=Romboutsia lituseburensis TaxID=1537 RepID=UPI00215B26FE|nr:hypothetical protein [Romboutsia lituseburensis]MCR8745863.1 hypothetical protein [Romboutsia lituseburensis]